jgi:chloramphenicol 3-O-phosphotransferase
MTFSLVISEAHRLATGTLSGSVRGSDIAAAIQTLYDDPAWQPGFDTFWDCAGITELLFEREDLPNIVALQHASSERAGTGIEIILVARMLDDAMASMYRVAMRTEVRAVHICRSVCDAERLLGRSIWT